jgi:hypothetical protein
MRTALVALVALVLLPVAMGFYLPGVAPRNYDDGESVPLKVNRLDSTVTQLAIDYYSLRFCSPESIEDSAENLGEVMGGDRIENSEYSVRITDRITHTHMHAACCVLAATSLVAMPSREDCLGACRCACSSAPCLLALWLDYDEREPEVRSSVHAQVHRRGIGRFRAENH